MFASLYCVASNRPSEERRTVLRAYVRDRLQRERLAEGRGYAARVARATGFKPAHISNVIRDKIGVGEDFAAALAEFWAFDGSAGLLAAAKAWWAEQESAKAAGRRYPAREDAAIYHRMSGTPEHIIQVVLTHPAYNMGNFSHRDSLFWRDEIKAVLREAVADGDPVATAAVQARFAKRAEKQAAKVRAKRAAREHDAGAEAETVAAARPKKASRVS